jgi:hypothetical protein
VLHLFSVAVEQPLGLDLTLIAHAPGKKFRGKAEDWCWSWASIED